MQAALVLHLAALFQAAKREARIGDTPGLDPLGLADTQLIEGRLQASVVEQGDLHRSVRRQRLGQQLGDPLGYQRPFFAGLAPAQLLVQLLLGGLLDHGKTAIPGKTGAAGQQQ
ncbi:hypothetical protein D3C80_993180 [compost metagenome]